MKFIYISIIAILCVSCGPSTNDENELNPWQIRKIERDKIANALTKKYSIKYAWDTLEYNYTFFYESVLESKIQLIKDSEIIDFYKEDTSYYLCIICGPYLSFYFTLKVENENILSELKNTITDDILIDKYVMVVDIETIRKAVLEIYPVPVYEEEAYLDISSSDYFFGDGKLLDLEIMENP